MMNLNIIGCGRLGRTLARLWLHSGVFEIGDVDDHALAKSSAAVAAIGGGRAVAGVATMRSAEVWMLATGDDRIAACARELAASGRIAAGNVVFHCSGTLTAAELAPLAAIGARVASVHPLKTFAGTGAEHSLAGVYCAAEGDQAALQVLRAAFERLGARVSEIDPRFKAIYHAASVIVCNYLTALIEAGLACYEKAGYARTDALRMLEPLARETLDHVFELGTARALTGPIARGDHQVVQLHLEALTAWQPQIAALYSDLGAVALGLARTQGAADPAALARIERVLSGAQK